MFCPNCGPEVNDNAVVCVKCGCALPKGNAEVDLNRSEKDWVVTLLRCFFVGGFGIHRFDVGNIGTGILQLITLGACGMWTLIDFIVIACGNFTDVEGQKIVSK